MFKEDYIKDNNQIHPDESFLTELKETIQEERQKIVQDTGEDSVEIFIGQEADYQKKVSRSNKRFWMGWAAAACVVLVCILGILSDGIDLDFSNDSLKGDVKTVFHSNAEDEKSDEDKTGQPAENDSEVSTKCKEQYQRVLHLFEQQNVIIYETEDFMLGGSGIEYLNKNLKDSIELSNEECSELVGNILAEKYTLTEDLGNLDKSRYYIAKFENGSGVSFIIGKDKYIYIHEMWGLQNVAEVYN